MLGGTDVLLITKVDRFSKDAQAVAQTVFGDRLTVITAVEPSAPVDRIKSIRPRILLSFLCPWVLPKDLLEASELAINWHPAPKEYPGIGCYNFALYEGAQDYGAVCHFMAPKVDTGAIIEERRFPILEHDTVETLKLRTMITMSAMFADFVCKPLTDWKPQSCGAVWTRQPFTRAQLNSLSLIDVDMPEGEVRRRIRAMTYPGYPGAYVVLGGQKFFYPTPQREPLA